MENAHRGNPYFPPPRPRMPAGGVPVKAPTKNDVLSGRGGAVNSHPGNKRYRSLVNSIKTEYLSPKTKKMQKTHMAAQIVWAVRESDPPGRFLKLDRETGEWNEIGDKAAFRKTGQALRENSSEFRSCWRAMLAAADGAPQGTSPVSDDDDISKGEPSRSAMSL
eukprot:18111_1